MRFGVYVPNFGPYGDPRALRDLAVAAESSGWDGFFVFDVISWEEYKSAFADPWVALGAIAQATSTITLGPMVTPVPRRRPWKLATEAATLQRLSEGRLILGVGAGIGIDYTRFGESDRRLGARLDEGTTLLRKLLSGQPVTHDGETHRGVDAHLPPADVPLWTSGFWPRKGPFRAVAGADGIFPQTPADDFRLPTLAEVSAIRAEFDATSGRTDGDLAIWSPQTEPAADQVAAYAEAGATWWFANGDGVEPDELRRRLEAGPPVT